LATALDRGKDAVALLRDASLLFLALLLIAFPGRLNSMLEHAGFVEGSIGGFKWQSQLAKSTSSLSEAQSTITDLRRKLADMSQALAEANTKIGDPGFKTRVANIETENAQLQTAAQQVQSSVTQTIASNAPLLSRSLKEHPPSDYRVGLQTLGFSDDERSALNDRIRAAGYGLHDLSASYPSITRPTWFAQTSTVFYYSAAALPAAKSLAATLKGMTGTEFVVRRGNGLGVDPAQRDVTLFVHYLK
jgi:hypothetical protein